MPTLTKKNAVLTQLVESPKMARAKKVQVAVVEAVAKATKARKATAVIVPAKPKNPIQIRHIRAEVQPSGKYALVGSDTVTDCGRIVVKQMTRKNPPTGATVTVCPHCMEHGHEDKAFQIVRGSVKLLATAANKAK